MRREHADDAGVLGAELSPAEVPVLAAHGDRPQRPLEVIRVERHVRVGQEHLQPHSPLACVVERLDERRCRPQPVFLEPPLHPGEKRLHMRLAVRQAMQPLGLASKLMVADVVLDVIKSGDAQQPIPYALWLGGLGLKQLSACVRLIHFCREGALSTQRLYLHQYSRSVCSEPFWLIDWRDKNHRLLRPPASKVVMDARN